MNFQIFRQLQNVYFPTGYLYYQWALLGLSIPLCYDQKKEAPFYGQTTRIPESLVNSRCSDDLPAGIVNK